MFRSRSFGILFLLAWGLAGCHSMAPLPALPQWQSPEGRDHVELGQIRETASGKLLTPAELVQRLSAAPRVLVGEQHDNPDHHALQLWLMQSLARQRPQGSLLLEMLEPVQQARVDSVRQQQPLPADLAGFPCGDPGQRAGADVFPHGLVAPHGSEPPHELGQPLHGAQGGT